MKQRVGGVAVTMVPGRVNIVICGGDYHHVWKCPSEDKAILILFYETYINKKLSDCLVGVFGVDSEKVNLVGIC